MNSGSDSGKGGVLDNNDVPDDPLDNDDGMEGDDEGIGMSGSTDGTIKHG